MWTKNTVAFQTICEERDPPVGIPGIFCILVFSLSRNSALVVYIWLRISMTLPFGLSFLIFTIVLPSKPILLPFFVTVFLFLLIPLFSDSCILYDTFCFVISQAICRHLDSTMTYWKLAYFLSALVYFVAWFRGKCLYHSVVVNRNHSTSGSGPFPIFLSREIIQPSDGKQLKTLIIIIDRPHI